MAAILKHWKEAATLMIVAPQPTRLTLAQSTLLFNQENISLKKTQTQRSDCYSRDESNACPILDYESLLLKRNSASKVLPNLYVFPGGTSENNDFSPQWIPLFEKLGKDFRRAAFEKLSRGFSNASPMFKRTREPEFSQIPPDVAFRISAIRETFEESGILIVRRLEEVKEHKCSLLTDQWNNSSCLSYDFTNCELKEWRKRVNKNPDNFITMCQELGLIPDILSLYEWSNWLTPTAMGRRRFDTIFYICYLENKPETKEDNDETTHYEWLSPVSALTSYYNHLIGLAPPQVYEFSRMMQFQNSSELMTFAADREINRVERHYPVVIASKDGMLHLLPGDDLYPDTPDLYTPNNIIQFNGPMEELNKDVKNFHRTITEGNTAADIVSVTSNIVFKNNHISPVENPQTLFGKL